MISSHVKISMISLISSLSLKLYLIRWCITETSSGLPRKVFGNLRASLDIFENSRKMFGNVCLAFGTKIFGKWSEIFGKSTKTPSSVCLHIKKHITRKLEDMNFMFSWQEQYLTSKRSELMRHCSYHGNIKFISSGYRVMFFLLYKHTDDGVFDDFPKISDHFPNISEDFPKLFWRPDEHSRTFAENFRRFPKISKDCQRLSRKTQRCFDNTPANLSTI